jgi:hypothetical protein
MESLKNRYTFCGQDITFDVIQKIEHTVEQIAEGEHRSFDDAYSDFLKSKTYRVIQDPESLMWYENAEFIVDEYYRESGASPNV